MQIKFLFINAINPSKEIETVYPPLSIGYLVSSLRKHFGEGAIEFKVIDSNIEQAIIKFKPNIVGISSVSQNYNKAIAYAEIAKRYELPVICGGVHISMLPFSLTRHMNIGVIGEGEKTICDLIEIFKKKNGFPTDDLQKIKGIIYWKQDKIVATERQTPIYPLDNIPLPARDLFNIGKTTFMFTSRGCLYRCAFCASSRFWSNIRFFSAEYVVNEIMKLREKYGVKHISFLDDLFSADVSRVREILALLKKKGILGKIKFACSIRANKVNDGIISMFKEMGVESIGMGLESGCDESLEYLKGDVTVEDNYQSVRTIRKFGISVFGSFIIGSPNEDMASIMKTLEFIKKSHVDKFGVYMLTPFPGTPVWDYAESRGLVGKNMNWDSLNVNFKESHKYAVLLSEKLTRQEIYELWMRFERYKFRQRICYLVRRGLQNPFRIPRFILEKLGRYWRRIWLISPS